MIVQLTNPNDEYELWLELDEIIAMERHSKPKSVLIQLDERPDYTAVVLKCGRNMSCKETPAEIMALKNSGKVQLNG